MKRAVKFDNVFENVMKEAHEAAEAAGDRWVQENTKPRFVVYNADLDGNQIGPSSYILDVCGFAYIEFKDKRSKFYKMCKQWEAPDRDWYNYLHIRTKHSTRQEMGLAEACMRAAVGAINKYYPDSVYMTSRID